MRKIMFFLYIAHLSWTFSGLILQRQLKQTFIDFKI
jgi:hypothetical protein